LRPTSVGLAEQIRLNRAQYPAIVVFPQTRPGANWSRPDMQNLVLAELNQTQQEFHGDPARVYLIGFSLGGAGVYRIAYRWRERFAALVAIAGFVEPPSAAPQQAVEIDRRSNGFPAAPDPFAALADGIRHIPLRIFHGDADQSVPVEQSRRLAAALKKVGSEPRYTEFSNTDHVGATAKAYATADLITWMFAQHR
jgi:predicted peptidase